MNHLERAQEEIRCALPAAGRIVAKRWTAAAILLLLAVAATDLAFNLTNSLRLAFWCEIPMLFAFDVIICADAIRSELAHDFCLNSEMISRLIGVTVLCYAVALSVAILVSIPLIGIHVDPRGGLAKAIAYATFVYWSARLAFARYLIKDYGVWESAARSWRLTKNATMFLPLGVFAAYDLAWFVLALAIDVLGKGVGPSIVLVVRSALDFALLLVAAPVIFVLLARWMLVSERLQNPVSITAQ